MSARGQISIPLYMRKQSKHKQFLITQKGNGFFLQPVEFKVIQEEIQEPKDESFGVIGLASFDSWNEPDDDAYYEFYKKQQS